MQFLEISQLSGDEGQYSKGHSLSFAFFFTFFFLLSETCKQIGAFIHLEILMQKVI